MKDKENKDTLIALMNNKSDFSIAMNDLWYRIPVKSAPKIVKENALKHIAFYQTKTFEEDAYKIQWHGAKERYILSPGFCGILQEK